jgi:hypothetical protein
MREVRRRLLTLVIAGALAIGASMSAAAELQPFKTAFSVTWHGISAGTAELQLQHLPDGRWSYQSLLSARGLARLAMPAELRSRSLFAIRDGRVVPELFSADDGTSRDNKDQDLRFDWSANRVTGTAERRRVDLPLQPGLLDTMSVQIALMHELLSGRTPQYFVLVDKDKIKDYNFTAQGEEILQTVLGQHRTVIFRSSRPGSTDGTWYWCAPDLGFLPLKVERREGKSVQLALTLLSAERT